MSTTGKTPQKKTRTRRTTTSTKKDPTAEPIGETTPKPRCEACQYCVDISRWGLQCRRYPTSVPTTALYWCGEFKEKSQ